MRILEEININQINQNSLADGVFEKGDILKEISFGENSITITRRHHVIDAMLDVRAGDTVTFTVIRNGEERKLSITITEDSLTAY